MTTKDKLAATLINHWYVIDRAISVGRIKAVPKATKQYDGLNDILAATTDQEEKISALIEKFSDYNAKGFAANLQHVISNDTNLAAVGGTATSSKLRTSFRAILSVKSEIGKDLETLKKALIGEMQEAQVKSWLSELPTIAVGTETSTFTIEVPCSAKSFKSLYELETLFVEKWNASKFILAAYHTLLPLMSEQNKKDVLAGKALVNVKESNFKDGTFTIASFDVCETPAAKAAREIQERLEIALKRRIKTIKEVGVSADTITYKFDDETTPPFKVALEVITHW